MAYQINRTGAALDTTLNRVDAMSDNADNTETEIHGATGKTTPADADTTALIDSAAANVLKKVTWANIKATLKTYFDGIYDAQGHTHTESEITDLGTYIEASGVTYEQLDTNGDVGTGAGQLAIGDHDHSGTYYEPGGTDVALADGGTGASLTDPNADRIMFWDDVGAGGVTWLVPNTGISISGTNLDVGGLTVSEFTSANISQWTNNSGYITDITGESIGDLSNVTITGPSTSDILQWSGTAWVDRTLAEAGVEPAIATLSHEKGGLELDVSAFSGLVKINGGTTSQAVAGTDYAAASHNHNASDINAGLLTHERGGLELDVSAFAGLIKISGGTTSQAVADTDYATPSTVEDDIETTTINPQTGTTYTLAATDRGQTITSAHGTGCTITIPTNATEAFATGTVINVIRKGAGTLTITGASGVTVNGTLAGSAVVNTQWSGAALIKIDTNEWIVTGDIT